MTVSNTLDAPRRRRINMVTRILALSLLVLFGAAHAAPQSAARETIVVRPAEIPDVLVNPGTGITTFQRFNGQALNPGLDWSEEGPTAKLPAAVTKPDFPDTS